MGCVPVWRVCVKGVVEGVCEGCVWRVCGMCACVEYTYVLSDYQIVFD